MRRPLRPAGIDLVTGRWADVGIGREEFARQPGERDVAILAPLPKHAGALVLEDRQVRVGGRAGGNRQLRGEGEALIVTDADHEVGSAGALRAGPENAVAVVARGFQREPPDRTADRGHRQTGARLRPTVAAVAAFGHPTMRAGAGTILTIVHQQPPVGQLDHLVLVRLPAAGRQLAALPSAAVIFAENRKQTPAIPPRRRNQPSATILDHSPGPNHADMPAGILHVAADGGQINRRRPGQSIVVAAAGQQLRVIGSRPSGGRAPPRFAAKVQQPHAPRLAIDDCGRVGRRPVRAGVLDDLHRRPRATAVGAPLANKMDLVVRLARVFRVVLPRLGKGQERAVRGRGNCRNAIGVVAVLAGDEDVDVAERRLGQGRGGKTCTQQRGNPKTSHCNAPQKCVRGHCPSEPIFPLWTPHGCAPNDNFSHVNQERWGIPPGPRTPPLIFETLSVAVHAPAGDWSIFGEKGRFAHVRGAENMDLSPSVAPRGTVPFSRR